jgi:hypothetical protein
MWLTNTDGRMASVFKSVDMGVSRRKERKTKWLEDRSAAYVALEGVVLNKKLLKDIENSSYRRP